jgi:hypothetical protein
MARRPRGQDDQGTAAGPADAEVRQYDTQKCLLGLVMARLDKNCPNATCHRRPRNRYHPLSHTQWLELLRKQFARTLDDGVVRIGKDDTRGALSRSRCSVGLHTRQQQHSRGVRARSPPRSNGLQAAPANPGCLCSRLPRCD